MSNSKRKYFAISLIIVAAILWSTSFAVTKVLLDSVPPLTIGALRFTIAAFILFIFFKLQKKREPIPLSSIISMSLAGFLGVFIYFSLENFGVEFASASDATLVVASYPIITLSIELVLRRTKFNIIKIIGMVMAIIGVWLVVDNGVSSQSNNRFLGIGLLLLGGVVWSVYSLLASSFKSNVTPLTTTYYQTLAGTLGFLLVAPLEFQHWDSISMNDLLIVIYLSVVCSIIAFLCYNAGLRNLSSAAAVNILNLVPVFGIISAIVIVGESVTVMQLFGGAIVILGVILGSVISEITVVSKKESFDV